MAEGQKAEGPISWTVQVRKRPAGERTPMPQRPPQPPCCLTSSPGGRQRQGQHCFPRDKAPLVPRPPGSAGCQCQLGGTSGALSDIVSVPAAARCTRTQKNEGTLPGSRPSAGRVEHCWGLSSSLPRCPHLRWERQGMSPDPREAPTVISLQPTGGGGVFQPNTFPSGLESLTRTSYKGNLELGRRSPGGRELRFWAGPCGVGTSQRTDVPHPHTSFAKCVKIS